jgi:hypothetical protein
MTTPHPSNAPAGWYPDPAGTGSTRWWNGVDWTDNLQTPYVEAHARQPVPQAAAGTPAYNAFIWAILGLLALSFLSQFLVNVEQTINASIQAELRGLPAPVDPASNLVSLLSFVIYGLSVLFAFLDWRQIKVSGVQKPFHWAWSFLSILVYLIGRGIIMKRRVGTGIATMWIAIGYIVASIIVFIVIVGMAVSLLMTNPDFLP